MPRKDGITLYQEMKAQSLIETTPVILITAKVLPSEVREFKSMGIAGVIAKPFDPTTLAQEIAKILGWQL
ncbi:MAG: response regulator [Pseudanabaenaceae cyanobacterium SKYGB_i_bin29]|nr:response regulator [Pseudanabaenaceae cyanobacterium SKYG29]MDW8421106.1 response regulator [Pseudanabaenaceae cyanobacterium SKYGB_i_bin29]